MSRTFLARLESASLWTRGHHTAQQLWALDRWIQIMSLIPSKLNFLPEFDGRDSLYSSISPEKIGGRPTIRILTVDPSHDYFAPIEASLSISIFGSRGQDDEYHAVSYHWGDINELETVTIHGSNNGVPGLACEVPMTKNLTAALRRFRAEASAHEKPLRLWIDALCINQTDAMERKSQVKNMHLIFREAMSVWIWLRESNEFVEKGLVTLINQTNSFYQPQAGTQPSPDHFLSYTLSPDKELLYIKQLAAISALPYWRRGWTFQENVQPRRYICYGKLRAKFYSWTLLLSTSTLYTARMQVKLGIRSFRALIEPLLSDSELGFLNDQGQHISTFAPYAFAEALWADPARFNFDPQRFSKTHFLQHIIFRTSDPRDAVLAISKIIPELADLELDYTSTPERIFSIATETFAKYIWWA
jgi:hypothetical protein